MIYLNAYANVSKPHVQQTITLDDWFSQIKSSEYSNNITQAREGRLDYDTTKLSLPCVTYNFTYNNYKNDKNIIGTTGLLYIDVDNPAFDISKLNLKYVLAYYKSFGGHGYSIIVRIDGITPSNFKYNYTIICNQLGISDYIDTSAVKASQYNILSYDEDIYINNNPYVFIATNNFAPPTIVIEKKKENIYSSEGGKIRFNNLDEIDLDGFDYIVNWEGFEYINCFIPMKKRESGNRNSFLLSYCNNFVILNPHLNKEAVSKIINSVNLKACEPPVPKEKVLTVVDSIFKYKEEGTLEPKMFNKKRKFVFNRKLRLSKAQKFEIMNKEFSKKKMDVSQQKINDILLDWNFEKLGKITQRAIYNNHPISKKTVEKYWSDFKAYITDLNNDYSKKDKDVADEAIALEIEDKTAVMVEKFKDINVMSLLYQRNSTLIAYVIENHEKIGKEGVEHFYNQVFHEYMDCKMAV